MERYSVTGMSCAACSARVEKTVSGLPGVNSCAVNLLTNSMIVDGSADPSEIIAAVERIGYHASLMGNAATIKSAYAKDKLTAAKENPFIGLRKRLIASLVFLLALMYISMGHVMLGWPLFAGLAEDAIAIGLCQLLLTAIIMVINQKFFISGFRGLIHRAPNMDTLVSLGAGAAFVFSTCKLFALSSAALAGDMTLAGAHLHGMYFESAAMILTLITVGKMLEARAKGKTTDAIRSLEKLAPETATIIKNGKELTVPIEQLRKGDIFIVRPGETIPADGKIIEGATAVNESALTGESMPADKQQGDRVFTATINQTGFIKCLAEEVGDETSLARIIRMVSDTSAGKAPIAKTADKVAAVFVPAVIAIAIITTAIWLIIGYDIGVALARGISVLVISCPCALGLATPVAIMVGSGVGARHGILFKTAESLESAGKTNLIVLDKTGTITQGTPQVTDIIPLGGQDITGLMELACSIENKSEHPLAKAICQKAADLGITPREIADFNSLTGHGIAAVLDSAKVFAGNIGLIGSKCPIPDEISRKVAKLASEGKTPLLFCSDGQLSGIIAMADEIREDSVSAISELRQMGIRVVMLTGDNKATAQSIGQKAGVDAVYAEALPGDKADIIRKLKEKGKVAMVGDGINDAPALTEADIGIAIGAGTDIAIDAADIVLMNSRLSDVSAAIKLSRATLKNIKENLFWAFFYNSLGIPLAAGAFTSLLGWQLNPMFAAAAMSLSSFCVVSNALRLNLFKINKNNNEQRSITMEKTLKIEGMMCPHCEAAVKKCLEAIDGVSEAKASHTEGVAVVTLSKNIDLIVLKKAVEDQGYTVL